MHLLHYLQSLAFLFFFFVLLFILFQPIQYFMVVNPLRASPTKWSNTLKQFVGNLPTNCLKVFNHSVGLVFKGLMIFEVEILDMFT